MATRIAGALRTALAVRPRAGLVVPGGASPRGVLARLATEPLDWGRVTVTMTDDRWVPPGDPASNEGQTRRLLADPAGARLIGLYSPLPAPEDGVAEAERRLDGFPWPADVVLLGMGEDGHVASLFPGAVPEGGVAARCLAARAPVPPHARISLSPAALLDARLLLLLVTGEGKRAVWRAAGVAGPVAELPVRLLHAAAAPVEVHTLKPQI